MDIIHLCSIYHYIYTTIVIFCCIGPFYFYGKLDGRINQSFPNNKRVFFFLTFFTLFIGLRPINGFFVDMKAYDLSLTRLAGKSFEFLWDTDNLIFDNLLGWWGCNELNHELFFLLLAVLYFICAFIGIYKLFPEHYYAAYLVFLSAFSTFSFATNGIKSGVAASIFLMALGFGDRKKICIPLMFISLGFHHSMIVPIVAYFIVLIFKNPKYYFYGWFFCLLMAVAHITFFQQFFSGFADEQGSLYLTATEETTEAHIGFRPDFILYSCVPVILGYLYEGKGTIKLSSKYSTLLHLYITTNAVWLLCMYASFNNRIAYLSWLMYPIVLIYPFFDPENKDVFRYSKFHKVAFYHLGFTAFMEFVYYGIFRLGN